MRQALSTAYAFIIRHADTPESREKVDRALGLIRVRETKGELLKEVKGVKGQGAKFVVTEEGINALDAFLSAHGPKPQDSTLEPMDSPEESAE